MPEINHFPCRTIAAQMIAAVGQLARIIEVNEHLKPEEEAEPISEIRITVIDENGNVKDIGPRARQNTQSSAIDVEGP